MADRPTGTVTFLFTDVEGSTRLWEQDPAAMHAALARHDALVEACVASHGGTLVRPRGEGDSRFAVFRRATDAVAAAATLQQALYGEQWPTPTPLRVRLALHTGEAELREGDYYGSAVNRCARLRAVAYGGQTLVSQATYDLVCDQPLAGIELRDLGQHRLKDLTRPERIFQIVTSGVPTDFPPLPTLDACPTNLPVQPTPFIGREQEVAAIKDRLLRPAVRLLTLTGPGGTGKTRLALQVAAELLDKFPDGVWFVDLAPVRDPALVAATIGATLGVKELGGQPLHETLTAFLRRKESLLLLDNFEQVVDAASLVAALLKAAPGLKVLVTSRAVLHLSGEQEVLVPPLTLPDPRHLPALETLSQYAAVALFIQRAQAVKPDFQITHANAPAVAEICIRLDGLPLAIELAAARTKLLPPHALLARLSSRLTLLTGGSRDLPARQQTLRHTVDWSYNLLDRGEQTLFRRLGVFVGGWTLAAAEAVCNAVQDLPFDILDGLQSLLNKSLLRLNEAASQGLDDEPRFTMLETIREYAVERLVESGEVGTLRHQHANYFLALTKAAERQVHSSERGVGLHRLEQEHDNVRAALSWSLAQGDRAATALELAGAMSEFWIARGYWSEGRNWLEHVLTRTEALGCTRARARVLAPAGVLAFFQDDLVVARARLEESLTLARELGDKDGIAFSLTSLAMLAHLQGNLLEAGSLLEASVALLREQGNRRGLAYVLSRLGPVVADQGNYPAARSILEEALAIWHELGDRWGRALALNGLGAVVKAQGEYATAQAVLEEALAISRELADTSFVAHTLAELAHTVRAQRNYPRAATLLEESLALRQTLADRYTVSWLLWDLGDVAWEQGDHRRAAVRYSESLALKRELGDIRGIAWALVRLAGASTVDGQAVRAVRLLGAAASLFDTGPAPQSPGDRTAWESSVAAARAELDEATFETAWAEGRAMLLEQAIAYALEAAGSSDDAEMLQVPLSRSPIQP